MGGIIVKQALIIANNESTNYPGIKSSVSAILFLGTPHKGSPSAEYADILFKIANVIIIGSQMSRWTGPLRKELVHSLRTNAKDLLHIAQDFRVHTGTMKIASFIEQQNMRGLNERIVDDSSGVTGASTERVVPMPGCDHRAICRHGERNSNYKKLLAAIRDGIPSSQLIPPSLDGTIKVDSQFTAEESDCLRSLAFPELDHRFQGISQALDDTCTWLDSYSQYQEWLQHQNVTKHQGLFWIKGKPGSGKSVLMKYTLKQILRDHPASTVISFFFNARGSSLEQCTLGLFRSLLHQLFRQHRELLREFLPYFKTKRDTYHSDWKWSLGELQEFFQSLITSFRVPSLFIFLDALDECDQAEVKTLFNFLARMTTRASSTHNRLSVCMSSRDYPHIKRRQMQ
ncbi:hypothetical protein GJ744_010227 [Endocarpon pusillum]|uniref:NACHT domain-containing protein n=1 Tax=Endocarpon pusillum TaxID=364733 RepID=A0A8H7AGI5_9EURO|nr:hypothetical protein GJ744_010227 [Endocarpon pusillum]